MPKVNLETGDWMMPEACTSDGSQVIGIVSQARTNTSDPSSSLGIGVFDFETESYKVIHIASVKNSNTLGLTLAPDDSHVIFGNNTQIWVLNLETGEERQILEVQSLENQTGFTITTNGYLYYCTSRDERNIWLSKIEDVPMQITDN